MTGTEPIRVIILAAGTGNRLRPLTENMPKPLVRAGGKTLIDHTILSLGAREITEIVVVGGYRAEKLKRHLSNLNRKIIFLVNPDYMKGNLLTLETAFDYLDGNILLMNADHIYPSSLIEKFLNSSSKQLKIACDTDRTLGDDDMKVLLDKKMRLLRIGKRIVNYNAGYIGMTFIPSSRISDYRNAVLETQELHGDKAVVEQVLGRLAETGKNPVAVDLSGFGWLEIDTIDDLKHAELSLKAASHGMEN